MTPQKPTLQKRAKFDNETEACRHCPTPEVHPVRIGVLSYEGDPSTYADLYRDVMQAIDRVDAEAVDEAFARYEGRAPRSFSEIDEAVL